MISGDRPLCANHVCRVGKRDVRCLCSAAVLDAHDDILRNVHETARKVPRICGSERRVGQTLTRTVCGDEVLEHRHALAEVGLHWNVDDASRWIGHESTHCAELSDVALVSAGTGVRHHEERVELRIAAALLRVELLHHGGADVASGLLPDTNHVLVALLVRDEALGVLTINFGDILVGLGDDRLLPLCHRNIEDRDRHTAACCGLKSDALDAIGEECRLDLAEQLERATDQLAKIGARQ